MGKVLPLHKVAKAIKLNDFVIGSSKSRVTKASLIYAELECGNEYLCEVEKFIGLTVLSENNYHTVWLAVVSVYMRHEEQN